MAATDTAKFVIEFYRGYGWYLGADPITTFYQTSNIQQAIQFDTREAAIAAISKYYNYGHNDAHIKYRWGIRPI